MLTITYTYCLFAAAITTDLPQIVHFGNSRRVEVSIELPVSLREKLAKGPIAFDTGKKVLRLSIKTDDGSAAPAIFARYKLQDGRLVLAPRYPLVRGVTYETTGIVDKDEIVRRVFRLPTTAPGNPPRVTAVYPSGDKLPANCLKFYLHFSQPMREGREIFEQVTLQDAKGNVVLDPWRRVELWNDDATRLTLWIHPGRVKQGLKLRKELGPVLKPNQEYRLVVSPDVRDAHNLHLVSQFVKRFRTVKEDHRRPLPSKWRVSRPHAGTQQPLTIRFGEPLDRALLDRFVTVHGPRGRLEGSLTVTENESRWHFAPQETWIDADYHIHINGQLEDAAGNTPLRVFDTDLLSKQGGAPTLRLSFRPQ